MSASRYLAYVRCAAAEAPQAEVIDQMSKVPLAAPINLWTSDPAVMIGTQGAIIGHLFTRALPSRRIRELNAAETNAAIVTHGQSLIRDYWGGYVAIFQIAGGDIVIVRDPSGSLPAFWREIDGGVVLAPQVGTPPFAASDGISVDLDALLIHMWHPFYAGEQTCLSGVREIVPGGRLHIGPSTQRSDLLWQPWNHITGRARLGPASIEHLRATVLDAIKTWAGEFASISSGLSGGLDSSIVCAGLAGATSSPRGFHMSWTDREGDEKSYAQLVARALDMPLDIFPYDLDAIDVAQPVVAHAARPLMAHYAQSTAKAQDMIAERHNIGAFFTGHGGDNVFGMTHSIAPILDRNRDGAGVRAVIASLRDVSKLHDASYATILLHIARHVVRGARKAARGTPGFLNVERLNAAKERIAIHPWLAPPEGIALGAAAHIRALARAVGYEGFHDRRVQPPTIAPLLAQPVMELCLGIPSWRWIEGGIDRSMARRAFSSDLPPAITARRTKGGPAGFLDRYYWDNEGKILSFLRSGFLIDHDLIRGVPLPDPQSGSPAYDRAHARRLLGLAGAESWARQWAG
ncbi:asparagine synthase-related protein [Sphingobium yanoikuyae]|uniref:asparagine synthase-related protein n=1 Tax=Sphingobium yanoikuyae TaxID=13690 RepID=UPI0035B3B9CB